MSTDLNAYVPNPFTEARAINRQRLRERPHEPKSLEIEINIANINIDPSFLLFDMKIETSGEVEARHIMLAR